VSHEARALSSSTHTQLHDLELQQLRQPLCRMRDEAHTNWTLSHRWPREIFQRVSTREALNTSAIPRDVTEKSAHVGLGQSACFGGECSPLTVATEGAKSSIQDYHFWGLRAEGSSEVPKLVTVLAQHYNNNPVCLSLLATPNCGHKRNMLRRTSAFMPVLCQFTVGA
jgi:hypothetical protein